MELTIAGIARLALPALLLLCLTEVPIVHRHPPLLIEVVPSPNFSERPAPVVNAVVIHSTVIPTLDDTVVHFLDPKSRVSAHYVIDRDGRVVQMVPDEKRAWHAGTSSLGGERNVNGYSVGIELVNLNDGADPYPDAQLEAAAAVIRRLRERYRIPDERIVSHAAIALPAGRKNDPAGLDLDRIRRLCGPE